MASRSSDRSRSGTAALAALLALVLLSGCGIGRSASEDWSSTARTSVDEASSAVATARTTLAAYRDGRSWQGYTVTVLADQEQALADAVESLDRLVPPRDLPDGGPRAVDALARAEDAVGAARRQVAGGSLVSPRLLARLDHAEDELDRAERALR